jgi:hypothetical protein
MENPFEFEDATPKIYRKSLDSHKAITKLSKRYGIKERTVYRWISDSPLTNVNGKTEKTTKVVKIEHSLLEKSDYGKDIYGEFIHAVDAKLLREKRYYVFEVNSEKYKEYLSKKKQKKSQANVHHYLYTPRN